MQVAGGSRPAAEREVEEVVMMSSSSSSRIIIDGNFLNLYQSE
jgi:hypothetical protein